MRVIPSISGVSLAFFTIIASDSLLQEDIHEIQGICSVFLGKVHKVESIKNGCGARFERSGAVDI